MAWSLKCAAALIIFVLAAGIVCAESDGWNSANSAGDIFFSGTAGFVFPVGAALYPGLEYIIASFTIADTIPVDIGGAAKAQIGFALVPLFDYSYITIGAGVFATAHISSRKITEKIGWLSALDFYISIGPGFNFFLYYGDPAYYLNKDNFGINLATFDGVNIYLTESFAIKLEFAYWGQYVGASAAVGVNLRI